MFLSGKGVAATISEQFVTYPLSASIHAQLHEALLGYLANTKEAEWARALALANPPTRHILPPSEIDLGLFWAVFTGLEGKKLFHRIG